MTHTKDEKLKLALEALEYLMTNKTIHYTYSDKVDKAITAIKQALAAPVQPPIAWPCVIAEADFGKNTITLEMQCSDYKVGTGQHWLHTAQPLAQPAPAVDLAAAIEYADARWSGVDVPVGWARHFANAICTPPAAPVQEPVAWWNGEYGSPVFAFKRDTPGIGLGNPDAKPLYTTPPAAQQEPVKLRRGAILRCIETEELCTVWATSTSGKTMVKWSANNFGNYTAEQIGELFWIEPEPAAQPAVPDSMTSADIQEHIEYVAGWNDCRQAMLEMMK